MAAEVSAHGCPEHLSEWTVELLDTLPEGNLRDELLDGTLPVSPSPVPKHYELIDGEYRLTGGAEGANAVEVRVPFVVTVVPERLADIRPGRSGVC